MCLLCPARSHIMRANRCETGHVSLMCPLIKKLNLTLTRWAQGGVKKRFQNIQKTLKLLIFLLLFGHFATFNNKKWSLEAFDVFFDDTVREIHFPKIIIIKHSDCLYFFSMLLSFCYVTYIAVWVHMNHFSQYLSKFILIQVRICIK